MKITGFPALVVSVVVALVVFGAVMPIFADTTQADDTFTNEGYFRMSKYAWTDEFNATWDHTTPTQITINDVVQTLPSSIDQAGVSIIAGDNYFLRWHPSTTGGYVSLYYDGVALTTASGNDGTDMTISLDSSGMLYSVNSETPASRLVETVGPFYAVDSDGAYIMKYATGTAYLNSDSVIYGCGRTTVNSVIIGTLVSGSIEDGATANVWRGDGVTAGDVTISYTEIDNYVDLYEFTKMTFPVNYTVDDVDTTSTLTYSFVVVPYEITAERATHPDGALTAILDLLPFLVGAGLVVGAVAWFITRKG